MNNDAAEIDLMKKNVLICDTQPVAVEGMKWLLGNSGDLQFGGSVLTLNCVYALLNPEGGEIAGEQTAISGEAGALEAAAQIEPGSDRPPCEGDVSLSAVPETAPAPQLPPPALPPVSAAFDAVVIDKSLGLVGVMEFLHKLASTSHPTPAVVWGSAISESEALRLLQAGARGILRRTSDSGTLLTCLRAVTTGGTWMEDGIFGSTEKLFNPRRSQLTHRESEVVSLVEKGFRNRDIARVLGIQTGTVKIHLKHIFEKTGVRGRYGLAFTGLQNKGAIPTPVAQAFTA